MAKAIQLLRRRRLREDTAPTALLGLSTGAIGVDTRLSRRLPYAVAVRLAKIEGPKAGAFIAEAGRLAAARRPTSLRLASPGRQIVLGLAT